MNKIALKFCCCVIQWFSFIKIRQEKSLRDKLQDEFLEDDGCDDSESDGEVSRSGVEQSEDNASEVEDIEWWFDNFAAIIFLMYFEMCREA